MFDNGLDLRCEVFDLSIGEVAEPEPLASAFDTDTYLASVFLQRTDIFRRLAEHISHVGSEIKQGAAGCSIVADLTVRRLTMLPTVPYHATVEPRATFFRMM